MSVYVEEKVLKGWVREQLNEHMFKCSSKTQEGVVKHWLIVEDEDDQIPHDIMFRVYNYSNMREYFGGFHTMSGAIKFIKQEA